MKPIREQIRAFYLDWVNNYLTLEKIAEDYGITTEAAAALIKWGKEYQNEHAALMQEIDQITAEFTTGE